MEISIFRRPVSKGGDLLTYEDRRSKVFVFMPETPRPTDAELEILTVLWSRGASTVREVHEIIQKRRPAQYTTIYNSDMSSILGATSVIIAPYSNNPLAVTVSEVTVDAKGNATITWSDTHNGTAHAVGSPVTLPGTLGAATGTPYAYIWGEVSYAYTPTLGYVMTGTVNLSNQIFMSPRQSVTVTRVNS